MLGNEAAAANAQKMLNPVSAANTAAATSGWVDVRKHEGVLEFLLHNGAVTGSITWTLEDATDGSGTGGAGITPIEGNPAAISAANTLTKLTLDAKATRGWVRCVGTIVTGPVLVQGIVQGRPKYT